MPPGRGGTRRRRGFRRPASDRSPAPCGTRAPPPPACPCTTAGMPIKLTVSARSRRASFEAPGAAASASWSARASLQAASASAACPRTISSRAIRVRQAASAAAPAGSEPARPASSDSDRRYAASASSVFPVASSREATAVRLRPTSTFTLGVSPRLGRQRLPCRQHRPVRRQRSLRGGRPCESAQPARSSIAPAPAARRSPSPCPEGRRACRKNPTPTSTAGCAAP